MVHVDAYRISDDDEFLELGIDEMLGDGAIVIIEWSDRVVDCLPDDRVTVLFEERSANNRSIKISSSGPHSSHLVESLRDGGLPK